MREFLNKHLDKVEALALLARLRQDQLEAALAGRTDESAFFAGEARALRLELELVDNPDTSCADCF